MVLRTLKNPSKSTKKKRNHRERGERNNLGVYPTRKGKQKKKSTKKEKVAGHIKEAPKTKVPPFDHVLQPRM
jgi:hypothetical protein